MRTGGGLSRTGGIPSELWAGSWQLITRSPGRWGQGAVPLHYTTTRLLCQVGILRADLGWDGCGAVLLSCSPVIIVTAAHCVARSAHATRDT